jgi:glucosamine-6-phosphate deaminase
MNQIICKDTFEFVQKSSQWCEEKLKTYSSIFLPTGSTPIPLYEYWEKNHSAFLNNKKILQLDEIITGHAKGSFWAFLSLHLPSYIAQIEPVEKSSHGAEVAVLGLGLNGHIAFHEPGQKFDFYKGKVTLTKETITNLKLENGTQAMTYGLAAIIESKEILMMVRGTNKKDIYKRFLADDKTLPAVHLKKHPHFTVIVEESSLI